MHEPPQKGNHKPDVLPRGSPNSGKRRSGREARQQGERMVKAPPRRGGCKPGVLPQDSKRRHKASLQGVQTRAKMSLIGRRGRCRVKMSFSTCEGGAPWHLGGGPTEDQIFNLKGPVEAKDIAPGIDARPKTRKALAVKRSSQSNSTSTRR